MKQKTMKKIGILNHPDFPIDEWSRTTINIDDFFEIPSNLTTEEIEFANIIAQLIPLDTDDDEDLIELMMKPSNVKSFLINIRRFSHQYDKKLRSRN